jgi:mannan endo-1,4-beta-mannosidase
MLVCLLLACCFSLGSAAGVAADPATSVTAQGGGFSVQGSTIYAPDGSVFVAKGTNVNGANWVWRLLSGEQPWTLYGENSDLDAIVRTFTQRGVVVVFESHDRIGTYYQGDQLMNLLDWTRQLAQRYKDNPYVWFDVMNEPGGRDGLDSATWIDVHQRVIKAIRDDAGANNIIIVEGATGGQDAGFSTDGMVQDSDSAILQHANDVISFGGKTYGNIVFSIHPYDLWNFGDAKMADFFDRVTAKGLAMIVGEYGVQTDQNVQAAAQSMFNTAVPRQIGRIVWHWDGGDDNDLTTNTSQGGGWEIDNCDAPTNLSWLGQMVWNDNHSG